MRGGSVGRTEDLSAQYALRYFASYVALEKANRRLLVDGTPGLVTDMAARLPDGVVRCSTPVASVVQDPGGTWLVTAAGRQGAETHRARQAVLAVPAPLVEVLAPELPTAKRTALAAAATPGSTTMVVAVDVAGLAEYRDWAFVTTVGAAFDCIINPAPGPQTFRRRPDGEEIAHFVCYGNTAGYRPDLATDTSPDATGRHAWVEDFLTVAPGLRGLDPRRARADRGALLAVLRPGRAAVLEELQRPVDGLHFAGDWSSSTAGCHGALSEARRVADAVLADVTAPT